MMMRTPCFLTLALFLFLLALPHAETFALRAAWKGFGVQRALAGSLRASSQKTKVPVARGVSVKKPRRSLTKKKLENFDPDHDPGELQILEQAPPVFGKPPRKPLVIPPSPPYDPNNPPFQVTEAEGSTFFQKLEADIMSKPLSKADKQTLAGLERDVLQMVEDYTALLKKATERERAAVSMMDSAAERLREATARKEEAEAYAKLAETMMKEALALRGGATHRGEALVADAVAVPE